MKSNLTAINGQCAIHPLVAVIKKKFSLFANKLVLLLFASYYGLNSENINPLLIDYGGMNV